MVYIYIYLVYLHLPLKKQPIVGEHGCYGERKLVFQPLLSWYQGGYMLSIYFQVVKVDGIPPIAQTS